MQIYIVMQYPLSLFKYSQKKSHDTMGVYSLLASNEKGKRKQPSKSKYTYHYHHDHLVCGCKTGMVVDKVGKELIDVKKEKDS